jgi:hypothetical protein
MALEEEEGTAVGEEIEVSIIAGKTQANRAFLEGVTN